ncbi:MAG TPA: hypothetical protein VHF22_06585, partial [Planctomycetota bacterium]|nr:hypothetical protein [Planctomycetota bacterium]
MSGIGRVPGSTTPTPATADDTTTHATTTPATTTPATTPTRTTTTTPARPTPPAAPPKASDIVPEAILKKYGLDPTKLTTASKYDGPEWSVGYYPYTGDIQYAAFGKYKNVFANANGASDGHGYWEAYSNPPSGLAAGSWIADGSIDESNFERATGIDITGDRPVDNAAYKLIREAGAPSDAKFGLLDKDGKQLATKAGDTLVPTVVKDGKLVEVENRDASGYYFKGTTQSVSGDVVWRLKGKDGALRGATTDKAQDRFALTGASDGVKFDFLDATGEPVDYNPPGDKIVPTFQDAGKWHAFVAKKDASGKVTGYEHQTLDASGSKVTSRETIDPAKYKTLTTGKQLMYRIETSSGALKGDGKVS